MSWTKVQFPYNTSTNPLEQWESYTYTVPRKLTGKMASVCDSTAGVEVIGAPSWVTVNTGNGMITMNP